MFSFFGGNKKADEIHRLFCSKPSLRSLLSRDKASAHWRVPCSKLFPREGENNNTPGHTPGMKPEKHI
jgi:hypothetical protein